MGLAAVFAGLAVLMAVLGFVYHLFVLVIAIPFGIVSYTLWYHASGRLRTRTRQRAEAARRAEASARARRDGGTGGFGAGPREDVRDARANGGGARGFGAGARNGRSRRTGLSASTPSAAEAYDVLGIDPGADPDRVRRAYRKRVKDVHPDTEGGNEREFKRVQRAYERLQNGQGQ